MLTVESGLENFRQAAMDLSARADLGNAAEKIEQDPLQFLADYAQFNQKAPYAVATITGTLGNLMPFDAQTHDILGLVHAAIGVDEMGMERTGFRDPHPVLARMMIEAAAAFYKSAPPTPRASAQKRSQEFYDVYTGAGLDLSDPVCAASVLGAHAASEYTAIAEFATIFELLKTRQPALVQYLEQTTLPAFPEIPAITWLSCHGGEGGVESIHAEYALQAAVHVITPDLWPAWQNGFDKIVDVLNKFFMGAGSHHAEIMQAA